MKSNCSKCIRQVGNEWLELGTGIWDFSTAVAMLNVAQASSF